VYGRVTVELILVAEVYKGNFLGTWTRVKDIRKPIIGAVSGFAVSLT
jgi:enoyl-CoA hydratase/carnithine racemase